MNKSPAEIAAEEYTGVEGYDDSRGVRCYKSSDINKILDDPRRKISIFLAGAQWQKEQDEKEVCGDCDGNGSTNPPYWTVRCRNCGGSGVK